MGRFCEYFRLRQRACDVGWRVRVTVAGQGSDYRHYPIIWGDLHDENGKFRSFPEQTFQNRKYSEEREKWKRVQKSTNQYVE